jgi:hypothetical protein
MSHDSVLAAEHRELFCEGHKPVVPEVQGGDSMLLASKVHLALGECRRDASAWRENLCSIVGRFAKRISGLQRQLVPQLVPSKLQLQAVIIGIGRVRALANDPLVAIHTAKFWMTALSWSKYGRRRCTGIQSRRYQAREGSEQSIDPRIPVDGLEEIRPTVPDVPGFEDCTGLELPLQTKRPLVRLLGPEIWRDARVVKGSRIKNSPH